MPYDIPWTPAPNQKIMTAADIWQPSPQDIMGIAAFGDAQYERMMRRRILDRQEQDLMEERKATLDYANKVQQAVPPVTPPAPAGQQPNTLGDIPAYMRVNPSMPRVNQFEPVPSVQPPAPQQQGNAFDMGGAVAGLSAPGGPAQTQNFLSGLPQPTPQQPPPAPQPSPTASPPPQGPATPPQQAPMNWGQYQAKQKMQEQERAKLAPYLNAGLKMMESDDPDTMQRGLTLLNQISQQTGSNIQLPQSLPDSQSYTAFSKGIQAILNDPNATGPQKLEKLTALATEARGPRQEKMLSTAMSGTEHVIAAGHTGTSVAERSAKAMIEADLKRRGIEREATPAEIAEGALTIERQEKLLSPEAEAQQIRIAKAKAENTQDLKAKDIDIPGMAESVIEGNDARIAIKGSMGNPVASKVQTEVLHKYPHFNFSMSDANYKWKQSSTNQRTINFAGGALPRLTRLDEQLRAMPNVDLNTINKLMRAVSVETGKPEYTNFESNRNAIVQEINTALSGSSTTSDVRVQIELDNLKSARSPAQIKGAITNLREALIARLDVDLSPIYPIEVVRGEKTLQQYKDEMFKKYRGNYGAEGSGNGSGVGTWDALKKAKGW